MTSNPNFTFATPLSNWKGADFAAIERLVDNWCLKRFAFDLNRKGIHRKPFVCFTSFGRWIMGKPYSLDLRERICAYVSKGNSARSAGRLFGVSAATAVRFAAEHRAPWHCSFQSLQGRPAGRFGKLAPHREFLLEIVQAEPDITLKEMAAALSETHGVDVQLSSLHRALDRAGLSYKKRTDRSRA